MITFKVRVGVVLGDTEVDILIQSNRLLRELGDFHVTSYLKMLVDKQSRTINIFTVLWAHKIRK